MQKPASLRHTLSLIQQRAQYAVHDDAQDALSWINGTAREALAALQTVDRESLEDIVYTAMRDNDGHQRGDEEAVADALITAGYGLIA